MLPSQLHPGQIQPVRRVQPAPRWPRLWWGTVPASPPPRAPKSLPQGPRAGRSSRQEGATRDGPVRGVGPATPVSDLEGRSSTSLSWIQASFVFPSWGRGGAGRCPEAEAGGGSWGPRGPGRTGDGARGGGAGTSGPQPRLGECGAAWARPDRAASPGDGDIWQVWFHVPREGPFALALRGESSSGDGLLPGIYSFSDRHLLSTCRLAAALLDPEDGTESPAGV